MPPETCNKNHLEVKNIVILSFSILLQESGNKQCKQKNNREHWKILVKTIIKITVMD